MAPSVAEAIPLVSPDDEGFRPRATQRCGSQRRTSALNIICVSAFVISIIAFLWNSFNLWATGRAFANVGIHNGWSKSALEVKKLRHPTLYYNLERVPEIKGHLASAQHAQASASLSPTMTTENARPTVHPVSYNWLKPSAVARVNTRWPDTHFRFDGWVVLTKEDRILLQARPARGRAGDCTAAAVFPARVDLGDRLLTIEGGQAFPGNPHVQITSLLISDNVDLANLTYNTLPSNRTTLGTFTVAHGVNKSTAQFSCIPDASVVIELACLDDDCRIEYSVDDMPDIGISILQT